MWKPGRGAYYPVNSKGEVHLELVADTFADGSVATFAGTLMGDSYYTKDEAHFILAWRKQHEDWFVVYLWSGGQQERIGKVHVSEVVGLDEPAAI